MSEWMEVLDNRNELISVIRELAPEWTLNGAGTSPEGFDISYDLPNGLSVVLDGSSRDKNLGAWCYQTADEDLNEVDVPTEVEAQISLFEARWSGVTPS